ncbi:hypothetical protein GH714_014765 [Hevea brasiliensis]|uniref:Exostosin GT47 domain-containing protein n=1 Tax=Hevea brasiliensis TaxID=3981 RepID=A0A6A6LDL0_HEVBR|nr:hypothetical protein GH714_014765 [Hevea brasiliensis]
MEKPVTRYCCNNQLWLVILVSFVFCFVLFCFDYSALTGTQERVSVSVSNYEDSISTHKSKSLQLPENVNETSIGPMKSDYLREDNVQQKSVKDSCLGRYIFIHRLPSQFNQELIENCESINRGTEHNICPYLVNSALGHEVENSQGILLNKSWYSTNQFLLEVIFHFRMKKYKCLTNDSSLASAIYVPFYAGLDVSRYLWGFKTSVRDQSGYDLVKWLVEKPEWKKMLGRDHFLVAGRLLGILEGKLIMSLIGVASLDEKTNKTILFSFAGAPRPDLLGSVRGKIIEECIASNNFCKLLECDYGINGAINCDNPVNVMRLFQNSVFCLQPPGDSYTRRSMFDSILAGCIPVFFHPGTAYAQYKWHLPKNYSKYSVYIPVRDAKDWKAGIKTLLKIPEDRVLALREEIIKLIPRIIYADPSSRMGTTEDAFDLAVKGILDRIERVRRITREGRILVLVLRMGMITSILFLGMLEKLEQNLIHYCIGSSSNR